MRLTSGQLNEQRQGRFGRPEFQERLARARRFQRKKTPVSDKLWRRILAKLGLRSLLAQSVAGVVVLAVIYFLTMSPVFLVKSVELNGANFTSEDLSAALARLGQQRVYLIPRNHILMINRHALLQSLQEGLPQVRSIAKFEKVFPDKLKLELEERKSTYVWQSGADYYLMDQDGVVFQKLPSYDPAVFSESLIVNQASEVVFVGQSVGAEKILEFLQTLRAQWAAEVPQTNYLSFSTPSFRSPDLFVRTALGFQVYFDLESNPQTQLRSLELILTKEIKPETYAGLSYIDLRLSNIAYYCYKDTPCAPENQPQAESNPNN